MRTASRAIGVLVVSVAIAALTVGARGARAHCDTVDGPVVTEARAALERGDVTPVLKWVRHGDEAEIRDAFHRAMAVRAGSPEARELADTYFFETVVRVHRAGEGAPYTGLEPAGRDLGPAVKGADEALESGSVDDVVRLVTSEVTTGVRERFRHAMEARRHRDDTIGAGRDFVAAYVEFVHYVERLHQDATRQPVTHAPERRSAGDASEHGHR